jgi:uncharacterized protein (TIGR03435 family)
LAQKPAFEAASIRVDKEPFGPGSVGVHGGPGTDDPGRITWRGLRLGGLINQAYDVDGDQVSGRASDLNGDRFIVTAIFPPTTTKEQFRMMLQSFLAERFHLVLHHETREVPGYEITILPGGPKFPTWTPDPNVPPQTGRLQPGQSGFDWKTTRQPPSIHVTNRQSMAEFAKELPGLWYYAENTRGDADRDERVRATLRGAGKLDLPRFVDKTGLTGEYELVFDFEGAMVPGRPSAGGTTLAEALEKLGLRLTKVKRVTLDVLVIDHADRVPAEN